MTTIQPMTIRDLHAAAERFGEVPPTGARGPREIIGWAGVIDATAARGKGELVDGMHRVAGLAAWAAENDGWDETVPVVVTDDSALVVEMFRLHDAGQDVDDLIDAALAK